MSDQEKNLEPQAISRYKYAMAVGVVMLIVIFIMASNHNSERGKWLAQKTEMSTKIKQLQAATGSLKIVQTKISKIEADLIERRRNMETELADRKYEAEAALKTRRQEMEASLKDQFLDQQRELMNSVSQRNTMLSQVGGLKLQIKQLSATLDGLKAKERSLANLDDQLSLQRSRLTRTVSQYNTMLSRASSLSVDVDKLNASLNQLKAKERSLASLDAQLSQQRKKLMHATSQRNTMVSKASNLGIEVANLKANLDKLKAKEQSLADLDKQLAQQQRKLMDAVSQRNTMISKASSINIEVKQLTANLGNLKAQKEQIQQVLGAAIRTLD